MTITLAISVITAIIIISMIASAISYSRQQSMKRKRLKISQYRQQADEVLSYLSLLLKIDSQYELITHLQSLAVNSLKKAYQLAPEDPLIKNHLQIQQSRLQSYKDGQRDNTIARYVTSDTELTQSQSQIGQISKLIDIYRNKGQLTTGKAQELQAHLQTVKVDLNINSNLYQADTFAEEGDITMYQMHVKQALEILKKTPVENKAKNARIRQLSELLKEAKRTNKIAGNKSLIKPDENSNEHDSKIENGSNTQQPKETDVKET
jgi:hypothetical protein